MKRIGILAYGSLIDDHGQELEPLIRDRILDVTTPFSVEFARSSSSRDGAPTLVPVETGGARIRGVILVLDLTVDVARAEDLLWRRETRNKCPDKHYSRPVEPSRDRVVIEYLQNLAGIETVLYTKIGANIKSPTPEYLADLAIRSARGEIGAKAEDGINYLICVKKHDIRTPLMQDYEVAVLRKAQAQTLEEAYDKIRCGAA